jgi:hypothetical protein
MGAIESKAEVFLTAIQSLSRREKKALLSRLMDDPELREDILDIAVIRERQDEPARPFREYLAERRRGNGRG